MKHENHVLNINVNGIFGDGMTKNFTQVSHNISVKTAQDWINGVKLTMNLTKELFKDINNGDMYIIGNAISTYSHNAPLYGSEILPYVDGVAHCHFGAYEEVVGESKGLKWKVCSFNFDLP